MDPILYCINIDIYEENEHFFNSREFSNRESRERHTLAARNGSASACNRCYDYRDV